MADGGRVAEGRVIGPDCAVLVNSPPYALAPANFRFAALAALAGRAPLGGQREVALATYLAARLSHDCLPERGLAPAIRAERASAAKAWLAALTLPAPVRPALVRLVDATSGEAGGAVGALRAVITVTAGLVDPASRLELEQLAAGLERG